MADLIDRAALLNRFERIAGRMKCETFHISLIETEIKEAPNLTPGVDVVKVKHGRWIFKHNPITDPKGYFIRIVCSECNLHTGQKSNYCPQCGAKMDGEERP